MKPVFAVNADDKVGNAPVVAVAGGRQPKPPVIHIGDRVRILRPRWIKRVGYPLVWTDLIEEVEADPRTNDAWRVLTGRPMKTSSDELPVLFAAKASGCEASPAFVRAAAMLRVQERGFGGNARVIVYEQLDDSETDVLQFRPRVGSVVTVTDKRMAKTGKRVPERHGGHGEDSWYEPGGLEDGKTHVILEVGGSYKIERCDVELVQTA